MAAYTLRQLGARLMKVVKVTTTETEQEETDSRAGMYVFRDDDGRKSLWSPNPWRYEFVRVETMAEADLVMFRCPACYAKNNGPVGTHSVMAAFAGRDVPTEAGSVGADGKPTRWSASGTGLDDLVLTPSILLDASRPADQGCHWHGFVGSSGIPPGHAG